MVDRLREATSSGKLAVEVRDRLLKRIASRGRPLEKERLALPPAIARLSAEGGRLVETLGQTRGRVRRLLEERIEDIGEQLHIHEKRLAEVERALVAIDQDEIEIQWVVDSLTHFDQVWDAMTIENRGRLVRAMVEHVELDESSGQVTALLVDLETGLAGGNEEQLLEATP